ncbi:MAG: hypothetical protein IT459_06945 [Planctomycetes bacterium]|nr:hypothetical protein [Planctomycetota bacterium]
MSEAPVGDARADHGQDNLYVCYTAQNYLKALYLAHQRFQRGERSKILALIPRGAEEPSFFATDAVHWAEIEHVPHDHHYVRILPRDRSAPLRFARLLGRKARLKLQRWYAARPERERLLAEARRATRVFLFLERSYFSTFLLRHVRCELVEEGCSTYVPFRRAAPARWFAPPADAMLHPGEHRNVAQVWLRRPELASPRVRPKVRKLELDYSALPIATRSILRTLFPLEAPADGTRAAVIVSQAWCWSSIPAEHVLACYAEVVALLRRHGFTVWFKPHPAEDPSTYAPLGCRMLNRRIPLDVLELDGGGVSFACAFSMLASSLETAPHLAERVVTVFDARVPVERVEPDAFDRGAQDGIARLAALLIEWNPTTNGPRLALNAATNRDDA